MKIKIQAITTSVNYSDYLVHTIVNKNHFDEFIVVTTEKDVDTQNICKENDVDCRVGNFGRVFNKGKAINEAIKSLKEPEWILLIDSDVVLPRLTRYILDNIHLNEQFIYGIDRMDCRGKLEWSNYKINTHAQHENSTWINSGPWITSQRVMSIKNGGYLPMGFFQLFNINAHYLNGEFYSEKHESAGNSDLVFSSKWPRTHRHLLPEIIGVHLCTSDIKVGTNWRGRKSIKFS